MTLREIYLTLPQRRFAGLLLAGAVAVPLNACGAANDAQPQALAVAAPAAPTAPTTSPPTQSGALPQGSEPFDLDPADFTTDIDNPYWPMSPGSRWVYAEIDSAGTKEDIVIEVLAETKRIANGVKRPRFSAALIRVAVPR